MDYNFNIYECVDYFFNDRRLVSRLSDDSINRFIKRLQNEKKFRFWYSRRIFILKIKDKIKEKLL